MSAVAPTSTSLPVTSVDLASSQNEREVHCFEQLSMFTKPVKNLTLDLCIVRVLSIYNAFSQMELTKIMTQCHANPLNGRSILFEKAVTMLETCKQKLKSSNDKRVTEYRYSKVEEMLNKIKSYKPEKEQKTHALEQLKKLIQVEENLSVAHCIELLRNLYAVLSTVDLIDLRNSRIDCIFDGEEEAATFNTAIELLDKCLKKIKASKDAAIAENELATIQQFLDAIGAPMAPKAVPKAVPEAVGSPLLRRGSIQHVDYLLRMFRLDRLDLEPLSPIPKYRR